MEDVAEFRDGVVGCIGFVVGVICTLDVMVFYVVVVVFYVGIVVVEVVGGGSGDSGGI